MMNRVEDNQLHLLHVWIVPSRLLHLLRVVLGRNNAHEIRSHHGFLGSEGNGKLATKLQVVCGDVNSMKDLWMMMSG